MFKIELKGPKSQEFDKAFNTMLDAGMDELTKKVEDSWKQKATASLDTSKDEYLKALKIDSNQETITVSLNGWLPVVVETGAEPFDLKPGLLQGRQSRPIPIGKPFKYFRTVSVNSPADSWIWKEHKHPGGVQINKQIQEEVDNNLVPKIFGDLLSKISI